MQRFWQKLFTTHAKEMQDLVVYWQFRKRSHAEHSQNDEPSCQNEDDNLDMRCLQYGRLHRRLPQVLTGRI